MFWSVPQNKTFLTVKQHSKSSCHPSERQDVRDRSRVEPYGSIVFQVRDHFYSALPSVAMYCYATSVRAFPNIFYYVWVEYHADRRLAVEK